MLYLFGFIRGDELIKDDLGVVGEVIELCFLYDEIIRVGERVIVFKVKSIVFV